MILWVLRRIFGLESKGLTLFLLSSRRLPMVQLAAGGCWLFCPSTLGTSCLSSPWPASKSAWWRSSTSLHICRASPTTRASSSSLLFTNILWTLKYYSSNLESTSRQLLFLLPSDPSSFIFTATRALILQPFVLNPHKIRAKLKHPWTVDHWNQRSGQTTSGILPMAHMICLWLSKIILKK